jgi:hypothetical protein
MRVQGEIGYVVMRERHPAASEDLRFATKLIFT